MERDSERFAVERSVYDRDWYYSDEGVAAARESLEARLDGGETSPTSMSTTSGCA